MRYRRHDLHGLLVIDKPLGLTSMDVVRRVRKAAGHCKTGHAGTLDPLATGVLICCFGKATKRVSELMGMTKVYEAEVDLSAFTATDDAEGERSEAEVTDTPDGARVLEALTGLTGSIEQTPPLYSAIKVDGRRAYDLARRGDKAQLSSRTVRIDRIELVRYDWPRLSIVVTCGKGTYIRSLARQIGESLGTGGYLTALRRTAIGPFTIMGASRMTDLPERLEPEHLAETIAVAS